ncbi:MAG: nicotinate (nicotinamide) nucleotide adenylyltransferase [Alphaproteobacteria bacterium RIFCSPLOWO2_01_FULL_40_26]|nr:MAG: nicotinate (nicotinamide) nucleotide adenylyltransferase [Alphaproteobacteria bacterium RIFCSPHIGHO2_02_FULL_40_34]OFW88107.1 MAG: nicotinate (nicotinamide) nucleotide adenylyltransferase [Alphaproteobacteria bacterium RIFCSPHIGHO2_01_FULL_40_8]OFW95013.1 MAG: nicotinate (nicotinamide) nucleotide adenylyltransferase [Alphaproteobacteria bacterium RIFCSPLOWO2_01_FULL_40_26]OFX10539.1 MAG: nicotinate (nicotinamide) nucleotide adenylyltransferase [Alphaproteobacteria bacterium RIFCSPLOWO2_0
MRVGLLGGSFNPPHQGHVYISDLAIKKLVLDQVWWIATKQNPLKEAKIYEGYVSRLQKCEKLIWNHSRLKIHHFDEIHTEKLIKKLKAKYKNIEFFWIMGADNLESFHRWKNFKKLISMIHIAIFAREKFLLKIKKFPAWNFIKQGKYSIFFTKNFDISSSKIRKNLHE